MLVDTLNSTLVKGHDDISLYCIKNQSAIVNGVVIIVHGIAEHLERYDYVAEKIANANLTVYRYDNRGHGKSGGQRAHIEDFNDLILDADSIVEYAKSENPNIPIFMLGHSMGGFITASYGIKYKNKLNGQVLSGAATDPSFITNNLMKTLIKIINKIAPKMEIKNDLADIISRDLNVVNSYKADPLVLKKLTSRFYYEFIVKGIPWLYKQLDEYEYPCFVIHGGDDKIVNKQSSYNFIDKISSSDKEIKIYDKLYHEILNENERDIVIDDIISWLYARI